MPRAEPSSGVALKFAHAFLLKVVVCKSFERIERRWSWSATLAGASTARVYNCVTLVNPEPLRQTSSDSCLQNICLQMPLGAISLITVFVLYLHGMCVILYLACVWACGACVQVMGSIVERGSCACAATSKAWVAARRVPRSPSSRVQVGAVAAVPLQAVDSTRARA